MCQIKLKYIFKSIPTVISPLQTFIQKHWPYAINNEKIKLIYKALLGGEHRSGISYP